MYINACMRDFSTALGQAPRRVSVSSGVSVGRRCFLCISSVGAWTALFAALHNETSSHDAAEPRIRSKGKGTHACRVGVSRKFGACADVKCAPSHNIIAFLASGNDPTCRVSIIYTTWPKSHAYHGVPRLEKS